MTIKQDIASVYSGVNQVEHRLLNLSRLRILKQNPRRIALIIQGDDTKTFIWFGPNPPGEGNDFDQWINIDRDEGSGQAAFFKQIGIGTWQGEVWAVTNAPQDRVWTLEWDEHAGYTTP